MKKMPIIAGGILAGLLVPVVNAEGERRPPEGERPSQPAHDRDKRPHRGGPDEMFRHMDRDGAGKISMREFFASPRMERLPEEKRQAIFGRLDRNGDGFLGIEEIRAMRHDAERHAREGFRKLDTDKSGGLSFAEFSEGEMFSKLPEEKRRQIFARMDTDGSGEIDAADRPQGPPGRPDKPFRPDQRPGLQQRPHPDRRDAPR